LIILTIDSIRIIYERKKKKNYTDKQIKKINTFGRFLGILSILLGFIIIVGFFEKLLLILGLLN
jgi:hypothetical protein